MLRWSKACEDERLGAQRWKQEAALSRALLSKPHTKELGQSYVPHATVPVIIQFASSEHTRVTGDRFLSWHLACDTHFWLSRQ